MIGDAMGDSGGRISIVTSQTYDVRGGARLCADLYLPPLAGGPLPVIVWIHGGGWLFGSRRAAPDLSRFFAGRGFAMIAVDYRLSNRATFPAQIEDLRTAIRWIRSIAPAYNLDPARIGLWGVSAGGHLAALAALCPPGQFEPAGSAYPEQPSDVQAVVVGYAPIDFLRLDADRPAAASVRVDPENLSLPPGMRSVDGDSFESLLMGAPITACPARVREANPAAYARPGAPPFLICHGLSDTTIGTRQSERLFEALAAHGNQVTLCLVHGLGHGFLNRTHLDDGPLRRMTVREHHRGITRTDERDGPICPMVETFFKEQLCGRSGDRTIPISRPSSTSA
jgi:acetyl esterase/lipase